MRRTAFCAATLVLLLGSGAVAEEVGQGKTTVRTGKHFRVVCHFDSARAADEALATVEALWAKAAAFYKIRRASKAPLSLHLYRDTASYEAAEKKLTGGAFKRNLAFAHHESQSAHVALQPWVNDTFLAEQGLPYQTRNLVAHEAAHLVRFVEATNYRSHPDWFCDGSAQYLKYEAMAELGLITDVLADPMSATSFGRVLALHKADKLPAVGALLRDDVAELEFFQRYGARRLFFRFLASGKHRAKLQSLWKAMRGMGGGSDFTERVRKEFKKLLGKTAYARLDEDYTAWLTRQKPVWEEVFRSLETAGAGWTQVAFASKNALAWKTQPVGATTYVLSGAVEILPAKGKQMNLLLARSGAGFVSVAFTSDYGITVFDYQSKNGGSWYSLLAAKSPAVVRGAPIPFEIRVDGRTLRVIVAGKDLGEAEIPKHHTMSGAWGLGAQSEAVGIWHGVAVRKP